MSEAKSRRTIERIGKARTSLQLHFDFMPLVRINAPSIYADREFQDWLNRVTLHGRPDAPGHRTATWHWPGHEVSENSDIFMLVEYPVGGDDDMPSHCWDRITDALNAIFRRQYWECVVWLTNTKGLHVDDSWVVVRV